MFGALNRFISRLDSDPSTQAASSGPVDGSFGFQVLRNTNAQLPVEPWFDFIIGINGHAIENPDPQLFTQEIRNCAGHTLSLDIWTAKGQRAYSISIPLPAGPDSLGLTLQHSPLNATQYIWHILTIPSPLSPAHLAGLLPHSDYILGTPSGTLRGESALGELVEDHLNRSLVLWVYNSEFDVVREVELIPRRGWGGEGALGAVLGFGALHRLPVGLGEEIQAPGEKLFEAEQRTSVESPTLQGDAMSSAPADFKAIKSQPPVQFLNPNHTPPPMMNMSTPTSKTASSARKGRNRGGPADNGFDDMFEEGAKKSKEVDYAPSKKSDVVAPPPRTGGPNPDPSPSHSSPIPAFDEDIGEPGDAEVSQEHAYN